MSLAKQEVLQIIYTCLGEINSERSSDAQLRLAPETRLLGSGAQLDSLEVVNLIVSLESHLADRLECPIVLVGEDTFSGDEHPFRDVDALAAYIVKKASNAR